MRHDAADQQAGTFPEADADRLRAMVAGAAAGDECAWEAIVGEYGRRIFAMAKSRLGDPEAAEEIAQGVFATLAEKLRDGAGAYDERGRFESWLFRITMNRVRDEGRRRRRRAADTGPLSLGSAATAAGDDGPDLETEDLHRLRRSVQTLDEKDREIIELRHHGELPFATIAAMLGEPLGTVLARHHRALKKIRRAIEAGRDRAAAS
jgi:RNA polymerase sigma-70 factor (ECF subfamily)